MASIRKHRGKWQVQVRRKGLPLISKTFTAREDALRWSRETERRVDTGELSFTPVCDEPLRFLSEILDRYERQVSVTKRSPSDRFHLRQIRRHEISSVSVAELTSVIVAKFRDDRLQTVSPATVRKELNLLGHALSIARKEWGVSMKEDVVGLVRKPQVNRGRERRIEPQEAVRLGQAIYECWNPLIRHVFLFALATGMRRGEILALRWADIDVASATAHLPQTKNGEPRRVPLSPLALQNLDTLREIRDARPEASVSHDGASHEGADLVFQISANAVRLAWERAKKRAEIRDFRFHDLRHEAISRFFEMGLSVPEVALISGHKDPRMLFRYTHLRAEKVAQKLAETRACESEFEKLSGTTVLDY